MATVDLVTLFEVVSVLAAASFSTADPKPVGWGTDVEIVDVELKFVLESEAPLEMALNVDWNVSKASLEWFLSYLQLILLFHLILLT